METNNDTRQNGRITHSVAIFGIGRAGRIHIGNLLSNPRVVLKYVVDPNTEVLDQIAKQYDLNKYQTITFDEAEKVFTDPEIRAVVISSTTYTHENLIIRALKAGKAVFCEKPIANSLQGIHSCYRLARDTNGILHCSFNRRFDPSFMEARAEVKEKVGAINTIKTISRDSPKPPMDYIKTSSGLFHDCAVHDIDLICWILGEWPTTVFAMANARDAEYKEVGDVDVAHILLRFPSGIIGNIEVCRHSAVGYDQRLEVSGMKGMLAVGNARQNEVKVFDAQGCHGNVFEYSFPQRYRESYRQSLTHFLNIIDGSEKPEVDALSAINVTKLASLCEESYQKCVPMTFEASESI